MDELLKSFPLSFLLRSFFSGVFFVLAYLVGTNRNLDFENAFSISLTLALIAGVTVYGIHRSLIFPLIEWPFNAKWAKSLRTTGLKVFKLNLRVRLISQTTIDNVVTRWDSRSKKGEKRRYRAAQIAVWADYIHLQFTSAWCVVSGSLVAIAINDDCLPSNCPLLCLVLLFVVAATVSNWRSHSLEDNWKEPD